jgi:gliding motility associated protien GldN
MTGDLTIYSPYHPDAYYVEDGDQFKYPITSDVSGGNYYNDPLFRETLIEYMGYLGVEDDTPLTDDNGDPIEIFNAVTNETEYKYPPRDTFYWESKDIVQYKIKEDWFFDKERSVLDVRIIGLAPIKYIRENNDPNGVITGTKEMFWLYFPECRYVFQNFFVQSRHNDSQRMSFDDLFWKRMFHSYIEKESNLYDREINTYKSGVNALLESEKIKEKIFRFEHDLWSF